MGEAQPDIRRDIRPAIRPDIRIVCFDVGGVLVRIHRSWPEVCQAVGLEARGNWDGEAHLRAHQTLMDLFGTGQITEDEWSERLSIALNSVYTAAELRRIHHAWPQDEYQGAGQLIDDLHEAGLETACLSNTTHGHWVRLVHQDGERRLAGDPEYPAVRRLRRHFASHVLGLAKPDPAIYRAVESGLRISGSQILFFDDLAPNVAAARDLGWNAEHIDPRGETILQIRRHLSAYRVR
jgi:FMN phosphatase YigB (HAD superfamily)